MEFFPTIIEKNRFKFGRRGASSAEFRGYHSPFYRNFPGAGRGGGGARFVLKIFRLPLPGTKEILLMPMLIVL